jgi:hypothetical protein
LIQTEGATGWLFWFSARPIPSMAHTNLIVPEMGKFLTVLRSILCPKNKLYCRCTETQPGRLCISPCQPGKRGV